MATIFDYYNEEQIERKLKLIMKLLREGRHPNDIRKFAAELGAWFDEFYSIAKARIKGTEKHPEAEKLYINLDDLRFATPKIVADYRAKRLKCEKIADLCCGVGFQTFSFAKKSKKVIAIDIDERKIAYARKNAEILGLKNIMFLKGDVLSEHIFEEVKKFRPNIIFCDPERLASEEKRSVESTRPQTRNLLENYSKITNDISIEMPPQIRELKFDREFEKEYVSINGELNRLDIYFGKLKKCDVSVVALPEEKVLRKKIVQKSAPSKPAEKYIYEISGAVAKAGLMNELVQETRTKLCHSDERISLATSDKLVESPFFKNSFGLVAKTNQKDLIDALKKANVGKIVLRKSVPSKEYWNEKTGIEKKISGSRTAHLFFFDDEILICQKISAESSQITPRAVSGA